MLSSFASKATKSIFELQDLPKRRIVVNIFAMLSSDTVPEALLSAPG